MIIDLVHAASETETATVETVQDQGLLASLGINGTLFIFQLINFIIVLIILWFLILKPLTKKMGERQKMIDDSIENAKKVQDNLQKSEQKYQERIDQAKAEANEILGRAVADSEILSEEMKKKAKKEIETLLQQTKYNIQIEKAEMMADLKSQAADLVVMALQKLLTEKIDAEKDKEMIEEMLKKL